MGICTRLIGGICTGVRSVPRRAMLEEGHVAKWNVGSSDGETLQASRFAVTATANEPL